MKPVSKIFQAALRLPIFPAPKIGFGAQIRGVATKAPPHLQRSGTRIGFNRLQDYYYDVVQDNLMIMKYEYPGEEFELAPPPVKIRDKFRGPKIGEDGKVVKKKGSIRPKRPLPLPLTPFTIPELNKIQIQLMMPGAIGNKYQLLSAFLLLQTISGEKATTIYSKSDVAMWKLRKGMPVGASVTLTGGAMYSFLDKLVEVVLPRIKEWPGLKIDAGDGTGNLALGLPPSSVGLFPDIEIIYDAFPLISGFYIVFDTTAYRNFNGRLLMSAFQLPFIKRH
ncbi:54S ribosomal protein L7, mitochondrial [Entomophthora muscae]|uniref:54S ribosomal protein L7, mitochondrial n=1 Tax=Entomophthora muscae TaxID=34485 RepID=A0ACC2T0P8_9FUNG|nr:54S ribosomal protein L7, mitochondrial [Entomophthora muscae]